MNDMPNANYEPGEKYVLIIVVIILHRISKRVGTCRKSNISS